MKDINMNFKKNVYTGEINTVDYKNAIKQKVHNILMLKRGDVSYKDGLYSNIFYLVGDTVSKITSNVMKEYINNAFLLHIPEAELIDIVIKPDYEQQKYNIKLSYRITYNMEVVDQVLNIGEIN